MQRGAKNSKLLLKIDNLHAFVEDKELIKGLDMEINEGDDFIQKLPDGYNTVLKTGMLTIFCKDSTSSSPLRAFVSNPEMLILGRSYLQVERKW